MHNVISITFHKEFLCSLWAKWSAIPSPWLWSSEHRQKTKSLTSYYPNRLFLSVSVSWLCDTPSLQGTDTEGSAPSVYCTSPIVRLISCPSLPHSVQQEVNLYGLFTSTPLPLGSGLGLVSRRHQHEIRQKKRSQSVLHCCLTRAATLRHCSFYWRGTSSAGPICRLL